MTDHAIVSEEEWIEARKALLAKEKEFTRGRDALSQARRDLPWVKVRKDYVFDTTEGRKSLADLFEGRSQLVVYHFMFGPDWEKPCKSCSFWADNFNGIGEHLKARDVSFAAISRAPLAKLTATAKRLGWKFKWVSSAESDFNFDFGVSFTKEAINSGEITYNFGRHKAFGDEMPGISVLFKDKDGTIYRTYSCYSRGLDMMNGAYQFLDLVPKGRDENGLPHTMAWVRLHDEYAS
jgi:predicted dithiol-disulfide oxidoreductase (DUF899 family)